jgi:hypothetical protein
MVTAFHLQLVGIWNGFPLPYMVPSVPAQQRYRRLDLVAGGV